MLAFDADLFNLRQILLRRVFGWRAWSLELRKGQRIDAYVTRD